VSETKQKIESLIRAKISIESSKDISGHAQKLVLNFLDKELDSLINQLFNEPVEGEVTK
jgi:hypothetical protein